MFHTKAVAAPILAGLLALTPVAYNAQAEGSTHRPQSSVQPAEDEPGFNCQTMGNKSGCEQATRDWDKDGKVGNADPWLNDPDR